MVPVISKLWSDLFLFSLLDIIHENGFVKRVITEQFQVGRDINVHFTGHLFLNLSISLLLQSVHVGVQNRLIGIHAQ